MARAVPPAPVHADRAEEFGEAWRVNQRIHLARIDAIDDEGLACSPGKRGGRSVARRFDHLHHVRVIPLHHRAEPLAFGLTTFATKQEPARKEPVAALEAPSTRRGNILRTLKQCGHAVPQYDRYGIWDWDRI